MLTKLTDSIIAGRRLTPDDDLTLLLSSPIEEVSREADRLRRALLSDRGELCTIVNGRSGKCPENCKFCAQSAHHHTDVRTYGFLSDQELLEDCRNLEMRGVHRYSIVTAGRNLGADLSRAAGAYRCLRENTNMLLCASCGLLTEDELIRLKEAGVTRYHANLETSRRNFPNICTTHTYDDKIACIRAAKRAGLEVCSGGILGLGETMQDRIDMAFDLADLKVDSIPLNVLVAIPGTPLADLKPLSEEEILRSVAIFRFICPDMTIRLAGGRMLMKNYGEAALKGGANATITGDMLTTSGNGIAEDQELFTRLGYDIHWRKNE
ncbi:biotin synthase BioB [Roseburia hominis]